MFGLVLLPSLLLGTATFTAFAAFTDATTATRE
jgi:hypothetical protein